MACAAGLSSTSVAAFTLKKDGAWTARHEVDGCHLSATFKAGRHAVTAEFTRYQPGAQFELRLIGAVLATRRQITVTKLDFGLAGTDRAPTLGGWLAGEPMLVMSSARLDGWRLKTAYDASPDLLPEHEARVTRLTFETQEGRRYTLALGAMDKPMAALRACTDNLLTHWGYNPAEQARRSRYVTPINSPNSWITTPDFPPGAIDAGENGLVHVRLDVGTAGQILGCHVIARSNPDAYAGTTCRLIGERARLLPALDESGAAIRSYYVTTVIWRAHF